MFDKKLASLANEMTTEQISKAILSLQEAQNGLNEPSFRQLLSFLDSDKAKERIHSNLAALEGVEKRKERQLWKLDENIKELKASSEDAADNIVQINRKITFLSTAIEDLLGKNIKRKVTITRTTF
jgi:predicted  nucleic acid-binding Zn-ribbon protein